jgi:small subunit ribosomal protein S8
MPHSDPVADMLTRIRNGQRARKDRVDVPFSDLKLRLAHVLKAEGFIEDVRSVAGKTAGQGVIELKLRYDADRVPVVTGVKRLSTPGARRYMGVDELPKIRNGLGVLILTTPKGLMTDREARKQRVGGEALCAIW